MAWRPGPIDWPEDGQFPPEERQRIIAHTLLKRVGSPADIARTVRFLMLDAPYITGQIIAVDGGRSVTLSPRQAQGRGAGCPALRLTAHDHRAFWEIRA